MTYTKKLIIGGLAVGIFAVSGWVYFGKKVAVEKQESKAAGVTFYVATNGSDNNSCTSTSSPCASLNGAYQKSAAGDTVEVAGGSYSGQNLSKLSKGTSGVVLRPAAGANVTLSSLSVGAVYVEVQGMNVNGGVYISGSLPADVHHVTLRDITAKSIFIVAEDILVKGGSYGGIDGCTYDQEDVVQIWQNPDSAGNYHASSRITFDGVRIHDITDHNNTCSDVSGSGNGRHVDCMQILAGHYITVRNSIFYNCATSDIIARPFRDTLDNLLFENNWFQDVMHPGAALNLGASGDTFGGTNIVRNNYIGSTGPTCQPAGCLKYYGNIMSIGSCSAGVTFDGNVFEQSWSATCGTKAKKSQPSFVGPTPSPSYLSGVVPNYHLAANDTVAVDAGSLTSYPATDIDGQTRYAGSAPDAGADERGATTPPPTNGSSDLNTDGKVDVVDLGILLSSWGQTSKPKADINQDSKVDVVDLGILLGKWGTSG